jgi:hypothetical protein
MERYKNLSGDSGVVAYEIGPDSLTVRFQTGETYLYTAQDAGAGNLAEMHRLAVEGQGLSSFISRAVRQRYTRKW